MTSHQDEHLDVGAYVLGVLDPADRLRFEAHLAGCPRCAAEIDELGGLEPLLAELVDAGPVLEGPGDQLLGRLVDEVSAARRRSRTRRLVLVAAAAVLVVGGPAVTFAVTQQDKPAAVAVQQFSATDPTTGVSATVGVSQKKWGSQVSLALSNVPGPKQCDLIAVSRGGERQTVTSWSVPPTGYGADSALQTSGGAALQPSEIDHFEVRTLDGQQLLVSVPLHRA
ncbi:zf-HC2 domain-containing protein [Kitasatospora sp. NPDC048540]|uniref:zf-HC2 domain-containing protein n=1 Tax=Kitasatospora sp. NPDC048540 TaxID=3155634 RepID=UPI003402350A